MSRALNKGRQTHLEVPSSNEPLPSEWGKALWYVCRLAALQAHAHLSAEAAAQLVQYFESLHTVIPCKICRGHYTEYFSASPYTEAIARDTLASMTWVEDLRMDVDARIKIERAGGTGAAAAAQATPTPIPMQQHAAAVPRASAARTATARVRHSNANASAPQRKYAIQSALHVAQMNHTGRKIGCNCGKKK